MKGGFLGLGKGRSRSRFVCAREDPSTFADVYVEYHTQVLRYFARRTLDPETSFDLMAETFAEMFAHLDAFRGDNDAQGLAWMWTIARHQLYRWRERGAVERRSIERLGIPVPSLGPIEYDRIEDLADLSRLRPLLETALAQLSDAQRELLRQRVVEQREYDDIARDAGVSAQVIRARISRALRQLAKTMDSADDPASEEMVT
jgi:RNA polymerase sigma factor (sigma-70 family)